MNIEEIRARLKTAAVRPLSDEEVDAVCDAALSAIGAGWIDEVIREIQEMPDRTSPEDFPEAMLVTAAELRRILESFAPSSPEAPLKDIPEARRSPPAGALESGRAYDVARGEKPGSAVPGGRQWPGIWLGCSECDKSFACFNGKAACVRNPVVPSSTAPMFQNVGGSEQEQTDRHLPNDAELLQIGREIRDASTAKPEDALLDDVLDSSLDPEDGERLRRAQAYAKEVLDDVEAAPKSGPLKRDLNDNESLLAWAVDYLTDALAGAQGVAKGALSASSAIAPRRATEDMADSVRGILQFIRGKPGATFKEVRQHCEMRGDDLSWWPEWVLSAEGYVTEQAGAMMLYEVMAIAAELNRADGGGAK